MNPDKTHVAFAASVNVIVQQNDINSVIVYKGFSVLIAILLTVHTDTRTVSRTLYVLYILYIEQLRFT